MTRNVLSINKVQGLVEDIDRDNFTMFDLSYDGQVIYNNRLRTTGGRYAPYDDHIEINPKMWRFGIDTIIGIIKHELCHYYIQHYDGGAPAHGTDFKALLYTVHGSRYAPRIKQRNIYRYFYKCQKCGTITRLKEPLMLKMGCYQCHFCGGNITPISHEPVVKYE